MKSIFVTAVILLLLVPPLFAQVQADLEQPLTPPVVYLTLDMPQSQVISTPPRIIRPPIVGPTTIVTAPQFFSTTEAPFGLLGRSETTIAIADPGRQIMVGWNDPDGFLPQLANAGLTGYGYSTDGGRSFVDAGALPVGNYQGEVIVPRGDPWLDVGGYGNRNFFFANLASQTIDFGLAGVGIIVHKGKFVFNHLVWDKPVIITPPGAGDFLDKEALAADKRIASTAAYISVTNFTPNGSQIELYQTQDGNHWTGPTVVKEPDPFGQQGSAPVVGPGGEVYVAWERGRFSDSPEILFKASYDKGQSFGDLRLVKQITGTSNYPPVGYNRTSSNDFPRIAVDLESAYKGRIYVTFQDATDNPKIHEDGIFLNTNTGQTFATGGVADGDIYCSYSDDGGASWSVPTLVSSAAPGDGKDQFWPVVSANPDGGVDITYYQDTEVQPQPVNPEATNISVGSPYRRLSSYQSLVDVFWAHSTDGGNTFSTPTQINSETSNWSTAASNIIPNYGDYITHVSINNRVFASWAQSAEYEVTPGLNRFVPSVAFALIKSGPLPSTQDAPLADATIQVPLKFEIAQNYPNPFNPETEIRFTIPTEGHVVMKIYNTLGEEIRTLTDDNLSEGEHTVRWNGMTNDGNQAPSGIYLYSIRAGENTAFKKMMLVR